MKRIYGLNYLSNEFYNDYSACDYPEIEHKVARPYMVLLIKIENNKYAIHSEQISAIGIVISSNILTVNLSL